MFRSCLALLRPVYLDKSLVLSVPLCHREHRGRVLCTCSSLVRNEPMSSGRCLPSAWEFRATVSGRSRLESRLPWRRHLEGYLLEWRRKLTLLGSILRRPEILGLNPEFERAIKTLGSRRGLKPVVVFFGTREVLHSWAAMPGDGHGWQEVSRI